MTTICEYCKCDFATDIKLNRHKLRQTGCMSWVEMNNMIKNLQQTKDALIKQLNISINTIKEYDNRHNEYVEQTDELIMRLRNQISLISSENLLLKETEKKYWNEVIIVAPFISSQKKKSIKNIISDIENIEDIRKFFMENYPKLNITNIIAIKNKKKTEISIFLEDNEIVKECQICFNNNILPKNKTRCKICKTCYTCETCEYDQFKKYKRCAFCNTDF